SLRVRAGILVVVAVAAIAYHERRPAAVPAVAEAPPPPEQTPEEPTWTPELRPPQPAEVIAAVSRAFSGVLPPEALQTYRAVAGDFTGDRSPDRAVPARAPAEKLAEINADLASFVLQDPDAPASPVLQRRIARVIVARDDPLLAVLHGVAGAGWRHPDAGQGYLLKIGLEGPLEVRKWEPLLAKEPQL